MKNGSLAQAERTAPTVDVTDKTVLLVPGLARVPYKDKSLELPEVVSDFGDGRIFCGIGDFQGIINRLPHLRQAEQIHIICRKGTDVIHLLEYLQGLEERIYIRCSAENDDLSPPEACHSHVDSHERILEGFIWDELLTFEGFKERIKRAIELARDSSHSFVTP